MELIILPECGWQLMAEVWEARLNDGHQVHHVAVTCCRHFDSVPCDCYSTQWYGSGRGGVGESLVVAMSSVRISISGVFGPVGWRDMASAALC